MLPPHQPARRKKAAASRPVKVHVAKPKAEAASADAPKMRVLGRAPAIGRVPASRKSRTVSC
ncbi:MAG: hypothetical protein SFW09_17045 [Hyphomicrobiaceae bacterium]|nr:hypothetical protein [Hyphomicrobiaceae bacterium]